MTPPPKSNLPATKRYITTHDASGKSVFVKEVSPEAPKTSLPNGAAFTLDYSHINTPTSFTGEKDLKTYQSHLTANPPLLPAFRTPGGTVIRHTESKPGGCSPMHRTLTLDYMVVLDGEIELILDSGETQRFKKGDTCIQRGTMHAWRNPSETEWCRMLAVLIPAEAMEVNGALLKEEFLGPPKF
jgi:quercetin dioxygenase-like cupin family protein